MSRFRKRDTIAFMGKKMVKKVKAAGSYIRFGETIQKIPWRHIQIKLQKLMHIFQGWKRSEKEGYCQTGEKVLGSTGKVCSCESHVAHIMTHIMAQIMAHILDPSLTVLLSALSLLGEE